MLNDRVNNLFFVVSELFWIFLKIVEVYLNLLLRAELNKSDFWLMNCKHQNFVSPNKACAQMNKNCDHGEVKKYMMQEKRHPVVAPIVKETFKNNVKSMSAKKSDTSNDFSDTVAKCTTPKNCENKSSEGSCSTLPSNKKSYNSSTSTPRYVTSRTSSTTTTASTKATNPKTLNSELLKYKKELDFYNNATRDLEQQYMKINVELGELQQKHARFIACRTTKQHTEHSDRSCTDSEFSLKRKYTQIFQHDERFLSMMTKKATTNNLNNPMKAFPPSTDNEIFSNYLNKCNNKGQKDTASLALTCNQEHINKQCPSIKTNFNSKSQSDYDKNDVMIFETPTATSSGLFSYNQNSKASNLDDIYQTLRNAFNSEQQEHQQKITSSLSSAKGDLTIATHHHHTNELEVIIQNLQNEQQRFRNVISEQQNTLQQYKARYAKTQQTLKEQKLEIQKLNMYNKDLQENVNLGVDQLRKKLDMKIKEIIPFSQKLRDQQLTYGKITKENIALVDRIRKHQAQVKELKSKIEELTKRKSNILGRLKNAERDLRVFRNYNATLKDERHKLNAEVQKLRDQLENLQVSNKQMLQRQREVSDKHCRDLQKRVCDLEQRLGRSNNSTSSVLQQRDRLISELQKQLNTLVHNFEISQKHIRILRRHIHTAANGKNIPLPNGNANNKLRVN